MKRILILAVLSSLTTFLNDSTLAANASRGGTVVAWGQNNFGQTDVPPGLTNIVSVAGGYGHSLALGADGKVTAWGENTYGQAAVPTNVTDVVAISTFGWHNLALKSDGTVVAWGMNNTGQSDVPAGLTDVTAISAGWNHSLALKSDGTLVGWGDGRYNQTNWPAGLSGLIDIASGARHSLALKNNGTVVAWGYEGSGINVPAGINNVVDVACGGYHSLALQSDGTVVAWSGESYGRTNVPPSLTNGVAIAGGGWFSMGLQENRTVVAFGLNDYNQTNVPGGLTNVVGIGAGQNHALAIQAQTLGPSISLQPQSVTLPARTNATFSVAASGEAPISYQWLKNGVKLSNNTKISGSRTNVLVVKNVTAADSASTYSVIVSNASGSVTSSPATLTVVAADRVKPRITVTSFATGGTNPVALIEGTSRDNQAMEAVKVQFNGGAWTNTTTSNNFGNWSVSMPLVIGSNVFRIQGFDVAGNASSMATRSFFNAMTGTLTVATLGNGRVSPAWTTTNLVVGKSYKLTAIPASGSVFHTWTGDIVSSNPDLSFMMQTNMTLTANFVPNPYGALSGTFSGLFLGTTNESAFDAGNSGSLKLTLKTNGSYSGKLIMLSGAYPVSGKLQLDPADTNTALAVIKVKRGRLPEVNATAAFNVTNAVQFTGVVVQRSTNAADGLAVTNIAPLEGLLVPVQTANPDKGQYNFDLVPAATDTNGPIGGSYGTASVDAKGGVSLNLRMADQNANATVGTSQTQEGFVPFFAPLYGSKGVVIGWLQITNRSLTATNITWFKPAAASKSFYPDGFLQTLSGSGFLYTRTNKANVVQSPQGIILLNDGVGLTISSGFTVTNGQFVIPKAENTNSIQFSINPNNGLLNGSFVPTGARRSTGFNGVLIRDQSDQSTNAVISERATGFFLETNRSGVVLINLGQPSVVTTNL